MSNDWLLENPDWLEDDRENCPVYAEYCLNLESEAFENWLISIGYYDLEDSNNG